MRQKKYVVVNHYIPIGYKESLDKLIENLTRVKNRYSDTHDELSVELASSYDEAPHIEVSGWRWETSKEEWERERVENLAKENQERRDKLQYEALKKKYES